ncbi:MAG: glycoside hydrolase family 99-like domain-containing protein [Alphaproteobacteria bacterium]|nr:glycoside hydrolase family 99-like domain-containing protein [Alphaproteobacteria bacterium]MCL2889865.1 glycoside hydrolase family 99-like domain-containing protein [Alphaproteobacteria bacterium]
MKLKKEKIWNGLNSETKVKLFNRTLFSFKSKNTRMKAQLYDQMNQQVREQTKNFVPLSDRRYKRAAGDPKIFAYYLPQFYQFPLNDDWHGKGFTEWTNVAKALPRFDWQILPRVPIDMGFYNLGNDTSALRRQVELAKQYGIHGFCIYYYWFSGRREMEKPLFNLLNDKSIDFPFFLMWTNESWTNKWLPKEWLTGKDNQYIESKVKKGDAKKFIRDAMPFFKDKRYLRIDGKPVLSIYKGAELGFAKDFDAYKKFIQELRDEAVAAGLPGLFLTKAASGFSGFSSQKVYDLFDMVQFFHPSYDKTYSKWDKRALIEDFDVRMDETKYLLDKPPYDAKKFWHGAMVNYDNTPRHMSGGNINIRKQSLKNYQRTLAAACKYEIKNHAPDKRFVFLFSWNEWAETAHIEPDHYYGYAYLEATRAALESARKKRKKRK